ncbi:CRE-SRE-49 protein [Caenorhabditis remanei]|uniref:CRE-SRE-49 protein n=1 Tax=Caenorhabditis remanei TaxID=31234 RepID=E3M186_CAERE|nr:CRE-SRE-49 protein [Caenorhabditis remanei]
MIFLVNGTYEMWVAIPIMNKALYTSWKYPYVMAVDISIFFLTLLLIIRASSIIRASKIFHINLRVLLIFQLCQWFEILVARYFMFPYIIGYRFLGDSRKIYHHFWTENVEEMVPLTDAFGEWPLFLGGFLYTHHFASCIFFLFSVSAERAIASFYLSIGKFLFMLWIQLSHTQLLLLYKFLSGTSYFPHLDSYIRFSSSTRRPMNLICIKPKCSDFFSHTIPIWNAITSQTSYFLSPSEFYTLISSSITGY